MNSIQQASDISETTFSSFKSTVDALLGRCISIIPKNALNYELVVKAVNEQFYSLLADRYTRNLAL